MKIKIGVMGSAETPATPQIAETAVGLGRAIGARDLILLTGATTGIIHLVGKAARNAGAFHIGISPGENEREHVERFDLPIDACDAIIYTGFGLKGRNVVLVRSCEIVLFIAGSMGSLNEFTIACDEEKVIGCLTGSGGVADEVNYLLEHFSTPRGSRVFADSNPDRLIELCSNAIEKSEISDRP